ncbi:MAG: NAD(P)-dependent alcohol dehydrogenase [Gammaproteobacteria bacterium]|nr:NAD(P)-dependent alcohol dehydrogenase [Rhodocyclaceae bacterium]MBU3910036.1 NAD(P)-dependent alcohol dehydrogenase [Gammaproteobacteria bacterium]MBU3990521.1 NAD(P)-dependent alcohol dehydrogenase [Gammaproteobacteria bacterium]MBU4004009.1 NAD(P)-dependent alcohol dehydrogenase [Gammaproteobacteria bacterium]MBU4020256.1 NAD(P)-dependent alcohol dehydrogenase [Gammaproteobacteria bacterium]
MSKIRAWAAQAAGQKLERYDYTPGPLDDEEVDIAVEHCGLCHSDLSMIDNDWKFSAYPLVPGHEAIGRIVAMGAQIKGLRLGQRVGVGWTSSSCLHCAPCVGGDQQLCGDSRATISGRPGGFAERVRAQWVWAIPLPDGIAPAVAGPLFCGGITVFTPFIEYGISPTSRVGVVGIGGLGHLAIKFAKAWGCEVTAFTSSPAKRKELMAQGAHRVVASNDAKQIAALAGSLDLVIVTVNVPLDWQAITATLAPRGRLHFVGAVLDPVEVQAFSLISGQKAISGSAIGSPANMAKMLEFCARHGIAPEVEHFPMSKINEAIVHLRSGKARYRIVLDADFD